MTFLRAILRSHYERGRQKLSRLFAGPDLRQTFDLAQYRARLDMFLEEDDQPLPPLNFVDPRQRRIAPPSPAPVVMFPAPAPARDRTERLPATTLSERT